MSDRCTETGARRTNRRVSAFAALALIGLVLPPSQAADLVRLEYRDPGLVVDLGVGLWAWPLPMDYDGDGDLDLVVNCPDKPYNGMWLFENPGSGESSMPVFEPARRVAPGFQNVRVSYVRGEPKVLLPGHELVDFRKRGADARRRLHPQFNVHGGRLRANQWHLVDWEGDGDHDLVIGAGDWSDYGWDDAWDASGRWQNGPLHGWVYRVENTGTDAAPKWADAVKVEAGGAPIDVYGWPSPCVDDFDGDGDLDIVCGEFLDRLTYFENVGSREAPGYAGSRFLWHDGGEIRHELQMIVPTSIDWDRDGDIDLIVGEEDGRVAFVENTGRTRGGMPLFAPPRFFRQRARELKFGALSTPWTVDWDEDGDEDIIAGNTAGHIAFIENLDAGAPPRFAVPRLLKAGGSVLRIQAGPNGSIQGPCEGKWGYTTQSVADWDHDGRSDIVVNSIWGEILWYRNIGAKGSPRLEAARAIEVEWPGPPPRPEWTWWRPRGRQLVTQWRTTPVAVDFDRDGLCDLVVLDHEGWLTLLRRERRGDRLVLLPPRRVFVGADGAPLRLNSKRAGRSGRRKIALVDWDGDGAFDLLVNSKNADWLRGSAAADGRWQLDAKGTIAARQISSHTTSPCTVDWNGNGVPELLVGAEDGHFYWLER